jgi:hypothetical protein
MDLLERVFGGPDKRNQFQDFIDKFQKGSSPYDDIDDREAVDRYGQIAPELSRDQYRESAADAFGRLSPQERSEFSHWLRNRASERGVSVPDYDLNDDGIDDRMQNDPGELAEMTTRVREREPNLFEQILGKGGTGGRFDNPIAKIAVAGIAAMAASKLMGRR